MSENVYPSTETQILSGTPSERIWAWSLLGIFFGLTIVLGLWSNGVHHDDDLTHFMFARWAWTFPGYWVHHWGRAGFTVPMSLVAWIGDRETAWHMGRGLSAIVSATTVYMAADYGRRMKLSRWWLIVPLCYWQPLFFQLAYTTLTETFMAFYLMLAVWLMQRRRVVWASVVFSIMLLCRHEAVVLLPIWCAWLLLMPGIVRWQRLLAIGLTLWAPIVQNALHYVAFGMWPIAAFFAPSGSTEYLATGPLAYVPNIMLACGLSVSCLFVSGLCYRGKDALWLPILLVIVFAMTHIIVKWWGVFASGGFGRFMVGVAPFIAIVALCGFHAIEKEWKHARHRYATTLFLLSFTFCATAIWLESTAGRLFLSAGQRRGTLILAAVMLALAMVQVVIRNRRIQRGIVVVGVVLAALGQIVHLAIAVRPFRLQPEHRAVRSVVSGLQSSVDTENPWLAPNPWVAWYAGHIERPDALKDVLMLESMPAGGLVIWDSRYSASDFHGLRLDRLRQSGGLIELPKLGSSGERLRMVVFRKIGPVTDLERFQHYPVPLTIGRGRAQWPIYQMEDR